MEFQGSPPPIPFLRGRECFCLVGKHALSCHALLNKKKHVYREVNPSHSAGEFQGGDIFPKATGETAVKNGQNDSQSARRPPGCWLANFFCCSARTAAAWPHVALTGAFPTSRTRVKSEKMHTGGIPQPWNVLDPNLRNPP